MDLFVGLENFLSKKHIPFKHVMLSCMLVFFLLFAIITGINDENYFAIISASIAAMLCMSFFGEIKKLYTQNQLVSFQKNIAIDGFDASIFAFFIFSDSGRCVFINRIAQNLFPGFKIRNIDDFIVCFSKYPKVIGAIRDLQIASKNMKQSHIDVPMNLHSDSTALWRIAVSPLPDHRGFCGWTIIDLTPSNNHVTSPDTNSRFLLDIINSSSVGYICINIENEIIFCNNTLSHWLGTEVSEIAYTRLSDHIAKGASDELLSNKKTKLTDCIPFKVTLKSKISDGIEVVAKQILQNADGSKAYLISKDAQQSGDLIQALGKTKLYFEHIFEDAPVGILITDGAETINACNRTLKNIIGVDKIDESASLLDFIIDEEQESVREKLYQLISAVYQSIAPFEVHFKTQKHKTALVYISKIEEHKRTKENDGLVMYFTDISERKDLQHQFVQSQKMQAVGQLAGGIAHDFNNLLTAMLGYCDLLLEKYVPSDQPFNDIMQIKQNANRASNLVRQLLAFSRQQTLQPKILSVIDMIGELSSLLKRLLGAKIDLKVTHDRDIGFMKVDQVQFEQVIINLAVNARDAMNGGGLLTIRTSQYISKESKFLRGDTMPPGEYILVEISDTGCGIPEKYLNRIFDPFFSTKEKGSGTGLGLSTVYGIVNQTGGFISAESEIDVGTKFSLYFPMVTPKDDILARMKNAQTQENKNIDLTGSGTILLVEDEDAVRMFSSRALRDKGYQIIEASNGEEALELIKKDPTRIDLVITDVVMPKMDGPTLMENVKRYKSSMKVIFISGYTEDNFRESLANNSSVHFLSKPFNLKELSCKVKEAMG